MDVVKIETVYAFLFTQLIAIFYVKLMLAL